MANVKPWGGPRLAGPEQEAASVAGARWRGRVSDTRLERRALLRFGRRAKGVWTSVRLQGEKLLDDPSPWE